MSSLLPLDQRSGMLVREEKLKGHHGNPLSLVRLEVRDPHAAKAAVDHIASNLTSEDKYGMGETLDQHLETNSFYIRFNKQQACLGNLRLGSEDPIRVRIRIDMAKPSPAEAKKALLGLNLLEDHGQS